MLGKAAFPLAVRVLAYPCKSLPCVDKHTGCSVPQYTARLLCVVLSNPANDPLIRQRTSIRESVWNRGYISKYLDRLLNQSRG